MTGHQPDDDQFDDEEAAIFMRAWEFAEECDKAERCADRKLGGMALIYLGEEMIQQGAQWVDKVLQAADDGEITLTDEQRALLLELVELAVDRPDWYTPGERILLPPEEV